MDPNDGFNWNFDGNITYELHSVWTGKPEPTLEVGEKFLSFLAQLERLHSSFKDWITRRAAPVDWEDPDEPEPEAVAVSSLGANLGDWVMANMYRGEWGDPWPEGGFKLPAYSNDPGVTDASGTAIVYVSTGGTTVGRANFEVGDEACPPSPALVTHEIYMGATLAVASVWKPPWANVRVSIWGQKPPNLPGEPPFPYSEYQMPWISYLCAERAAKLGVLPDLITERTPDGGLLMSATLDRFDPTNVEHMRASRQIAEIMIEHGGNPSF